MHSPAPDCIRVHMWLTILSSFCRIQMLSQLEIMSARRGALAQPLRTSALINAFVGQPKIKTLVPSASPSRHIKTSKLSAISEDECEAVEAANAAAERAACKTKIPARPRVKPLWMTLETILED